MRELRYFLELPDGTHRDEASISFAQAENLLKGADWNILEAPDSEGASDSPYMLFLDEGESFFMLMPEPEGLRVTVLVLDKWNLFGLLKKDRKFTLNFGLMALSDVLTLLKLFYEDNYPALRSLEMQMDSDH